MSGTRARVLLHVQHLLGTGHTRRMASLARALAAAGADVLLASGGQPLPDLDTGGARTLQLPPLRAADASYTRLLDAAGRPIDEAWRERRARLLLDAARDFAPRALVIETFPFGRRMLRFELLPLLARLHDDDPALRVWCSVRDVLEPPRKPGRAEETVARLQADFHAVLVHGEERLTPLALGFPLAGQIADRVHYTGYVTEPPTSTGPGPGPGPGAGAGEVLVSAGGGAVGLSLLRCALAARALAATRATRWRLLVAPGIAEDDFERLRAQAPPDVVVERNRPDFRRLLASCQLSVSQAGYNTLAEGIAAGARLVAVPFAEAGEREQGIRARAFAEAGLLEMVSPEALTPASLAAAVDRAAGAGRPPPLASDGAAVAARLILEQA